MKTGINRIKRERGIAAGLSSPWIPGVRVLAGAGIAFLLIASGVLFACSTAVQDSPLSLLDENGNHPAGWIQAHGSYAAPDGGLCKSCHGENLDGGISAVSCASSSYNGQSCHVGGPAFHPADWLNKTAIGTSTFHGTAFQNGILSCALCHQPPDLNDPDGGKCYTCHFGTSGARTPGGWSHPLTHTDPVVTHSQFKGTSDEAICVNCHDTDNQFGNMPTPFCHNCHGSSHSVPSLDHNQVAPLQVDFDGNCSGCHSIDGSAQSFAPACTTCHKGGSPYIYTNCRSCHGKPPDGGAPVYSNFPNLQGKHDKHKSVATCSDCHSGGGSGAGLNHGYDNIVNLQAPSGITFSPGSGNVTCAGTCHENHNNRQWY